MGLRFTGDRMVPGERFQRLRDELGNGFLAVEIDSSFGNPYKISPVAHSALSTDYQDKPGHPTFEASKQVIRFFQERLFTAIAPNQE